MPTIYAETGSCFDLYEITHVKKNQLEQLQKWKETHITVTENITKRILLQCSKAMGRNQQMGRNKYRNEYHPPIISVFYCHLKTNSVSYSCKIRKEQACHFLILACITLHGQKS